MDSHSTGTLMRMEPAERHLWALEVGSEPRDQGLVEAGSIPDPVESLSWGGVARGGQCRTLWRVSLGQVRSKGNAGKRTRT